jgi:hypothetical protein
MKRIHQVFLAVGIIVAVLVVAPLGSLLTMVFYDWHTSNRERRQLLYETDHAALLAACRQVIANRKNYPRAPWDAGDPESTDIDPADPLLPDIIRGLEPRDIYVTDEMLRLELHGAFDHYGVKACSATAEIDPRQRSSGIELLPALVYHDDGLHNDRDAWIKKLKDMKPREADEPAWWSEAAQ